MKDFYPCICVEIIPYYQTFSFWIGIVLSLIGIGITISGLVYSIKAFKQAKDAKKEAIAAKNAAAFAGKIVKMQSISIDLLEISQLIEKLDYSVDYSKARDFFNFVTRKLNRLMTVFEGDPNYKEIIGQIDSTLEELKTSLEGVRPIGERVLNDEHAVYYAIESHFTKLIGQISKLMGRCENKVIEKE